MEGILDQYLRYVKPAYDNFVRPTSSYADIVRPHALSYGATVDGFLQIVPGHSNDVAIELISTHIRKKLTDRSNSFRRNMAIPRPMSAKHIQHIGEQELGLIVMPSTPQLKVHP